MVFKRFRIRIAARVLLLAVTMYVFIYVMKQTGHVVTLIILGGLLVFETIDLIRFAERTNRRLSQFLESIKHADFSTSFSDRGLGRTFEGLNLMFNDVINEFKKYRAEKEEHYNYLQTVVQHVSIGIIAYRRDGSIDIFNNAVKRLLKINRLRNINDLKEVKKDLPEMLLKMHAGDRNLVKIFIDDELLQVSIYATEFRMRGEEFILVSLQNINSELEEKEIESWQKLIRVLTHEIMNSITPISSLASTVEQLLISNGEGNQPKLNEVDEEDIESVHSALTTIKNRSQGLLNFVEIYRNLTRIPKPNFRYFAVNDLFERASQLLKPKMEELGIDCSVKVAPQDLKVTADPDLIDQVVINLLVNAIDAVKEKENSVISVVATLNSQNRVIVDIADNGSGIKPDIMDKIFMPFFTSKKHGSGIGLSLSRQIMHLHKGNITVKSKLEEGTVFTLTF
ncbi:MAG: GHKL domain-containing protein [Bacteroidales bacterium]|nr:GHKL domain-containing protein [Bacteroidales bacterium]